MEVVDKSSAFSSQAGAHCSLSESLLPLSLCRGITMQKGHPPPSRPNDSLRGIPPDRSSAEKTFIIPCNTERLTHFEQAQTRVVRL